MADFNDGGIIQAIVNFRNLVKGFVYGENTAYDRLLNSIKKIDDTISNTNNVEYLKDINKNLQKINLNMLETNKAILQELRSLNSQLGTVIKNNPSYVPPKQSNEVVSSNDEYLKGKNKH
jgi:SPX domain protein involved in polyphosphate accumulation